MRLNRRLLYAGVFLVAIGAVLVLADLGIVGTPILTDVLRLWPLALIAIGVGLVLRRSPQAVAAGILAAAIPGVVLGGALAVTPSFVAHCGAPTEEGETVSERGTFDGPATVSVSGACGSFTVGAAPGNAWQLDANSAPGRSPTVRSSNRSLSIDSTGGDSSGFFSHGRRNWHLALPAGDIESLSLAIVAGQSHVALPGARVGRLALTANVGEMTVDASSASVSDLSGALRFGMLSIVLPANSDSAGSLRVSGGSLRVCSPPGLGLRVTATGSPGGLVVADDRHRGDEWQSADYATAAHRADLRVNVNFGSVEINPTGGCK